MKYIISGFFFSLSLLFSPNLRVNVFQSKHSPLAKKRFGLKTLENVLAEHCDRSLQNHLLAAVALTGHDM